jgi:hypothetical protein
MKDYKNPIKMRADDPICSASALGNTIIGILFDKKGSEIKQAIQARTTTIDRKVNEYQGMLSKVDTFIKEKKVVLKELDEFYRDQTDKKEAFIKPYQDSIEKIHKEFDDKLIKINKDMTYAVYAFDKDTSKQIGKKAMDFEKSFDDFKKTFSDVSEFLKQEDETIQAESLGYKGLRGVRGLTGSTESPGVSGNTTTSTDNIQAFYSPSLNSSQLYTPTEEDEATARLNTLRSLLTRYSNQVEVLKSSIHKLEEEKRRLNLISDNINPDREYKLDLNKLSAFGFEDIEVN